MTKYINHVNVCAMNTLEKSDLVRKNEVYSDIHFNLFETHRPKVVHVRL